MLRKNLKRSANFIRPFSLGRTDRKDAPKCVFSAYKNIYAMAKYAQKPLNSSRAGPVPGLFDRIILAIKREEELQNTRSIFAGFFTLLLVSSAAAPFSWMFFAAQAEDSGIFSFLSASASDLGTLLKFWPDFALAIAESLPIAGIAILAVNIAVAVFTLRLFLYRKRMLLGYILYGIRFS